MKSFSYVELYYYTNPIKKLIQSRFFLLEETIPTRALLNFYTFIKLERLINISVEKLKKKKCGE